MRMEARDDTLSLAGHRVKATFPPPSTSRCAVPSDHGVSAAAAGHRGQKTLAIQVTGDGLMMDNITMHLEPNDMMLYPTPIAPRPLPAGTGAGA